MIPSSPKYDSFVSKNTSNETFQLSLRCKALQSFMFHITLSARLWTGVAQTKCYLPDKVYFFWSGTSSKLPRFWGSQVIQNTDEVLNDPIYHGLTLIPSHKDWSYNSKNLNVIALGTTSKFRRISPSLHCEDRQYFLLGRQCLLPRGRRGKSDIVWYLTRAVWSRKTQVKCVGRRRKTCVLQSWLTHVLHASYDFVRHVSNMTLCQTFPFYPLVVYLRSAGLVVIISRRVLVTQLSGNFPSSNNQHSFSQSIKIWRVLQVQIKNRFGPLKSVLLLFNLGI